MILRSNGEFPDCRSSEFTFCQPLESPESESSKAKLHSPLRFVQSFRQNCGRGYSGRGIKVLLPFCWRYGLFVLRIAGIRGVAGCSSKGLVALRFGPGQLESQDVNEQALEVLKTFCSIAYLLREHFFIQAVGGESS